MSKQLTWRDILSQLSSLTDDQLDRPAFLASSCFEGEDALLNPIYTVDLFVANDCRMIDNQAGTLPDGKRGDGNDLFADLSFPYLSEDGADVKNYLDDGNFFLVVDVVSSYTK